MAGLNNLGLGQDVLRFLRKGSGNLVVGNYAGSNIVNGNNNLYVGNMAGNDYNDESNAMRIGPRGSYLIVGNFLSNTLQFNGTVSIPNNAMTLQSITLTNTTNQIVLGTTNTTTISSVAPSASRVYTIADFGGAASFALTSNTSSSIKSGTWVPTLGDGTNPFTLGGGLIATYSQVGDAVFCSALVPWTSTGSASGAIKLSLPFTIGASTAAFFAISYMGGITWSGTVSAYGAAGANFIEFLSNVSAGSTPTALVNTAFGSAGQIVVGGYFRTV